MESIKIGQLAIDTLDHGKKTKEMAMADRKPQPPSMKEISSEIKKKVLEF
jgi:hypothetical protein